MYDEIFVNPKVMRLHFDAEREDGTMGVVDQILVPELTVPEILDTKWYANARQIACALLEIDDSEILPGSGTHMIFKPATAGRDTPWHQDEAYWEQPKVTAHSLSVWTPLDDVTVDSGCMQFLPGSHRSDIVTHRNVGLGQPLAARRPAGREHERRVPDRGRRGDGASLPHDPLQRAELQRASTSGDLCPDPRTGRAARRAARTHLAAARPEVPEELSPPASADRSGPYGGMADVSTAVVQATSSRSSTRRGAASGSASTG